MIITCNCIHYDQDRLNGFAKRVHNVTKKHMARCTVCKSEKPYNVKEEQNGTSKISRTGV